MMSFKILSHRKSFFRESERHRNEWMDDIHALISVHRLSPSPYPAANYTCNDDNDNEENAKSHRYSDFGIDLRS